MTNTSVTLEETGIAEAINALAAPICHPLVAPPGHDWPLALWTGGCGRGPGRTTLVGISARRSSKGAQKRCQS